MLRLLPLGLGAFVVGTDAYMTAGLLPGIARDTHGSVAAVGQLVTAFTLCYALLAPLLGSLLSRLRARRVLLWALAVFTAANLATALAGTTGLLLAARSVAGVGAGLFMPVAATAAAALAEPGRRARALAVVLGGLSSGTVLGVPLGLALADRWGWRAALWLVTALGAAALLGTARLLPDITTVTMPGLRRRLAQLRDPKVGAVVAATFLQTTASLGLYTYLAAVLHGSVAVWQLWLWGLGGVAGSFGVGPLMDRWGRPAAFSAVLLAVLAGSLAGLAVLRSLVAVAPLLLVWGAAGWAFVVPQQHRLLARDQGGGPAALALNSSATYLGGSVGSALGGLALARGVPATGLPLLACAAAVAGLLLQLTAGDGAPSAAGARSAEAQPTEP
ncbi:MFS transporter [Streptomyces sp. NPDC092296]|uniref:MFS transporter n=1 Tax=Streptomyces sp. NPDC092296 TaxID=3366012 RepID=UPI00381398FE